MAMVINEALPDLSSYDIKILASDINTEALEVAKNGIYSIKKINISGNIMKWFHESSQSDHLHYEVDDKLKQLVRVRKLNLISAWPMKRKFDVIFFRNVSIYMTKAAIDTLLRKFTALLEIGGFLILGHAESLGQKYQRHYEPIGKNIFRKVE